MRKLCTEIQSTMMHTRDAIEVYEGFFDSIRMSIPERNRPESYMVFDREFLKSSLTPLSFVEEIEGVSYRQ